MITEGELWEIVGTGNDNVKNIRVKDDVIRHYKTECSSHALVEVVVEKYNNNWILVTRSRIGK